MTIFALDTAQNGTKVTESTTGKTGRRNGEAPFRESGDNVLNYSNYAICRLSPTQRPITDIVCLYTHKNLFDPPGSCSEIVTLDGISLHDMLGEATFLRLVAIDWLSSACEMARRRGRALVDRILSRIAQAESREAELWFACDYRVAWLTLKYAFEGLSEPYARACYQVSGHRNLAELVQAKSLQLTAELACPELIEQFKRDYKPPRIGPGSVRAKEAVHVKAC